MATSQFSELQIERRKFKPQLPLVLRLGAAGITPKKGLPTQCMSYQSEIKEIFPNTYGLPEIKFIKSSNPNVKKKKLIVGVVLSGGQAPGGHNVIAGLFDGLKKANPKNSLIGFLGGPSGILENKFKVINKKVLEDYRNTGGFDFIQSGRTKIETAEHFETAKNNFLKNKINALVIVGGDDSNTNAAFIAEYVKKQNLDVCIVGVPKTIDGDLKK